MRERELFKVDGNGKVIEGPLETTGDVAPLLAAGWIESTAFVNRPKGGFQYEVVTKTFAPPPKTAKQLADEDEIARLKALPNNLWINADIASWLKIMFGA